jgi:fluoride ion exporter CrcB/FEX
VFFITGLAGAFTTFSGWALALTTYSRELGRGGLTTLTRFTRLATVIIFAIGVPVLAALSGYLLSQMVV